LGHHRVDQLADGLDIGVMRAERGAGLGIKAALEQGAEDGGVDVAPVQITGGGVQFGQVGGLQRRNVDHLKQAAIEPGDVVVAILAVRAFAWR
jgi:hypothetical protein